MASLYILSNVVDDFGNCIAACTLEHEMYWNRYHFFKGE